MDLLSLTAAARLDGLDPGQRRGVEAGGGLTVISAGAGTGKTLTMTARVGALVAAGTPPGRILAATFTRDAAAEMRGRADAMIGAPAAGVRFSTLHALASSILRRHWRSAGLASADYALADNDEGAAAMAEAVEVSGAVEGAFPGEERARAKAVSDLVRGARRRIDRWKENGLAVGSAADPGRPRLGGDDEAAVALWPAYADRMSGRNLLEFSDLTPLAVAALEADPAVLAEEAGRWSHILVDEWQDTNAVQLRLVALLSSAGADVTVCGDDDQCLVRGSPVRMADGTERAIEDVRPGDAVLSRASARAAGARSVTGTFSREVIAEPVVTILTSCGKSVTSTLGHTHFAGWPACRESPDGFPATRGSLRGGGALLPGSPPQRDMPHVAPEPPERGDGAIALTLCAGGGSPASEHRLLLAHSCPSLRNAVRAAGFSPVSHEGCGGGGDGWKVEISSCSYEILLEALGRLDEACGGRSRVVKNAALGEVELPFRLAGDVMPGMSMIGEDGEALVVAGVERWSYTGTVHDINVENSRNFMSGGIATHNSLYGFRGAIPRLMERTPALLPGVAARGLNLVRLETNRRCTEEILAPANMMVDYNPRAEPKILKSERRGSPVSVSAYASAEEEADGIARRALALVSAGSSLSEIAVLVRHRGIADEIGKGLVRARVPHEMHAGIGFLERREVMDMLAYLKLAANPSQDLAFQRIAARPTRGLGPAAVRLVLDHAALRGAPVHEALSALSGAKGLKGEAARGASDMGRHLCSLAAAAAADAGSEDMLLHVLDVVGYREWARAQSDAPRTLDDSVRTLIEISRERPSLPDFLEHAALAGSSEAKAAGAVHVGTLHGSKGREWDHVFLPAFEEDVIPSKRAMEEADRIVDASDPWCSDSAGGLPEERRLGHVGLTRARVSAHISYAAMRRVFGKSTPARPSRILREAELDLPRAPRPAGPSRGGRGGPAKRRAPSW